MKNILKKISSRVCSVIYRLFGHWFPDSYFYLNIGKKAIHIKCGMRFRRFLAKRIIDECGTDVNIERFAKFNRHIHLGNRSGIGSKSQVGEQTYIGDDVMMGPEVVVYTQNHDFSRTDIPICQQGFREVQPVRIGNDVWIGRRVIILPGVTIGNGCVIGAGAVVAKDIPDYSVAVGVPARVVKNRLENSQDGNDKNQRHHSDL